MCVHSVKITGPLVEKDVKGIFKTSVIKRMNVAGQLLAGEVKKHTPVGVSGILRGSIAASGTRWTGSGDVFENRVFSPQRYGIVIEYGRKAPGPMPPIAPLELWVRRKGVRLAGRGEKAAVKANSRSVAYAIALKIARKGFRKKFGYQMFKTALLRKRPEIRRLLGPDAALEIADRLNGNKKY